MDTHLTVTEVFKAANLSPRGPVLWGTRISDLPTCKGVYVVARIADPNCGCEACALPFEVPLRPNLILDLEYERQRWLPNEPVLYIGQTTQSLRNRIAAFYRHEVGSNRPHAGGQVVKLLECARWVYWSPAGDPEDSELLMICAFRKGLGQLPFANKVQVKPKRIRLSN